MAPNALDDDAIRGLFAEGVPDDPDFEKEYDGEYDDESAELSYYERRVCSSLTASARSHLCSAIGILYNVSKGTTTTSIDPARGV